jgi:hypothetical protein
MARLKAGPVQLKLRPYAGFFPNLKNCAKKKYTYLIETFDLYGYGMNDVVSTTIMLPKSKLPLKYFVILYTI